MIARPGSGRVTDEVRRRTTLTTTAVVVPYDPRWPDFYERARFELLEALGDAIVSIEHVGSTAVPGLAAKPVIDIAIGVDSLERPELVERIVALGYVYVPEYEQELPFRRYFRRGYPDPELHPAVEKSGYHLHVVESGHAFMRADVAFRDHLRSHPDDAAAYAELKLGLSGLGGDEYYDAKAPFVAGLKRRLGLPLFYPNGSRVHCRHARASSGTHASSTACGAAARPTSRVEISAAVASKPLSRPWYRDDLCGQPAVRQRWATGAMSRSRRSPSAGSGSRSSAPESGAAGEPRDARRRLPARERGELGQDGGGEATFVEKGIGGDAGPASAPLSARTAVATSTRRRRARARRPRTGLAGPAIRRVQWLDADDLHEPAPSRSRSSSRKSTRCHVPRQSSPSRTGIDSPAGPSSIDMQWECPFGNSMSSSQMLSVRLSQSSCA